MSSRQMIFGTSLESDYRPSPIPQRKNSPIQDRLTQPDHSSPPPEQLSTSPFVELCLPASDTSNLTAAIPSQYIKASDDQMRKRIYDMRQIAQEGAWFNFDRSKTFYEQAEFMQDVLDDYDREADLQCYYPRYQKMNYAQLRTYFTWRAEVREGRISNTSLSYAFLYIYELLNNIGVVDPCEGLTALTSFWYTFRNYDATLDRYVIPWLKDYHVYYPLPHTFAAFVLKHNLQKYYPTIFCYSSDKDASFDLFSEIASYNIKNSTFYTEENRQILHDCFFFVLTKLRSLTKTRHKQFEDYVFYARSRSSKWKPFSKALFWPAYLQAEHAVKLSSREVYRYDGKGWTYKTAMLTNHGKQLIGYILKEMEASLRNCIGFKHKLTVEIQSFKHIDLTPFEKRGINLTQTIKQACLEFYGQHTWKTVSVDPRNLTQIRKEALNTQEKLLVPENACFELPTQEVASPEVASSEVASSSLPSLGWASFQDALLQEEVDALALAADAGDLKTYAANHHLMLEVLVDTINQKAIDHLGDALLEINNGIVVYDEYQEDLKKVVAN